jgi:uncharacterized membrane protein
MSGTLLGILFLCSIPIIVIVLAIVVRNQSQTQAERELQQAQSAYQNALKALKAKPNDPNLHEQALALGRAYSNLTRDRKGVTLYDEMAVMNDLNAATAGAAAAPTATASTASVEERLKRLSELRTKGAITDQEFAQRRQKILDEL